MPNGDDAKEMLAKMVLGDEVLKLVLKTGLVVPRQKPGRKPGAPVAKVQPKPSKPIKQPVTDFQEE